jgi:hypothetical protein
MLAATAWKNIWRNKVRSSVVITAITIGLFAGTFAVATMNGMVLRSCNEITCLFQSIDLPLLDGKYKINIRAQSSIVSLFG